MHLEKFIAPKLDLPRLTQVLDELGHEARLDAVLRWGKKEQAILFEAVKGTRPLTLDDFVPGGVDPLKGVIHHGKNTLPAFSHFQKRFCKPPPPSAEAADASDATGEAKSESHEKSPAPQKPELWGYNHNPAVVHWAAGSGYFVVHAGEEGEVDIDYRSLPPSGAKLPESWPPLESNAALLHGVVYGGMIDVMRGISSHVSIGRAKKKGQFIDAWFVLCREDP